MIFKLPKRKLALTIPVRSVILCCFFVSGACGLIYEVAWLRVMGLIFGNTTYATATVLAGYMAGLGLGALFLGRRIDRGGDPVRFYGFLEGGVALYAFLTPLLWKAIDFLHFGICRVYEPVFFVETLIKFILVFGALLIPTFLMGGTLPVISKYFIRGNAETARGIGLLYALNTLGAILGVFASGFFLLYACGVWQTVILTGVLNLLIFLICLRLRRDSGEPAEASAPASPAVEAAVLLPRRSFFTNLLLFLFGLSGAASMMYEVGWTRVLGIALGSSVYAFSVMLATFLTGIAVGSYLFSLASRYFRVRFFTFALLEILTALFAMAGLNQFNDMPYYFIQIFKWSNGVMPLIELGKFGLCSLVMLPPTLCIGALFSCFIHVYQRSDGLGNEVGSAYFANTIGTIFGSGLTGFLIIPWIGIQNTLIAASVINGLIGLAAFFFERERYSWKRFALAGTVVFLAVAAGFSVEPWNRSVIASDAAVKPAKAVSLTKKGFRNLWSEKELLFYKEGASATVSVQKTGDDLSLSVNGKVDASSGDAFTQAFLGHLPMLLNPGAKNVLVIGLGSGSTAAAIAAYPAVKIDCVELEKAVVDGARFFSVMNRNVLEDLRLRLIVNDGRNYLRTTPERYDVIVSEPSNPWIAGVANLFSLEHYRKMSERLASGGVVCQWVHAYSMSPEDLKMIIRTFNLAFKDVSLWMSYYPDLLLIGRNEPRAVDFRWLEKCFENPVVKSDFAPHGIKRPEGVFSCYLLGDEELRTLGMNARVNSDNHPFLEFSAPKNLFKDTIRSNWELIDHVSRMNFPAIVNLEPPPDRNPRFYDEVARGYISKRLYGDAAKMLVQARKISPEDTESLVLSGVTAYFLGANSQALEALSKAAELRPEDAEAYYYFGLALEKQGQPEIALSEYAKASGLAPEEPRYLSALADVLTARGEFAPALKLYDRILTLKGNDFDTMKKMTDIVMRSNDIRGQVFLLGLLMERYPRLILAYERLGEIFETGKLYDQALKVYQQLVGQYPREGAYYVHLARVYKALGNESECRKALKKAVRFDPRLARDPQVMALRK